MARSNQEQGQAAATSPARGDHPPSAELYMVDEQLPGRVLRQALQSTHLGMLMTRRKGNTHVCIACNRSLQAMLGWEPDELIGRPASFFMGQHTPRVTCRHIRAALVAGQRYRTITRHERGDGLPVWLELELLPIESHSDGHVFTAWVYEDITQRIALEELWHRHQAIVNASRDFLLLVSRDGIYEAVNDCYAGSHGFDPRGLQGKPVSAVRGSETLAAVLMEQLKPVWKGKAVHFELWRHVPSAGERYLDVHADPYRAGAMHGHYAVVVARDLTERKLAEDEVRAFNLELEQRVEERTAELAQANRQLEAFGYTVAHDLRAPLHILRNITDVFAERHGSRFDREARHQLDFVREGLRQMDRMISDLLEYARLGHAELRLERVQMKRLVQDVAKELRTLIDERGIEVHLDPLPPCRADATLMRRVFANLLSNAVKFTRDKPRPRITIGAKKERGARVYVVRDNGVGFDRRHAEAMFGVFRRLHDATAYEGTGVGLAIVQRAVERHGGKVWAEGKPGKGAAFFVRLPDESAS